MRELTPQRLLQFTGAAVLVVIVVLAIPHLDRRALNQALGVVNARLLLLAAVANLAALAVQAWRWNLLLVPLGKVKYTTSLCAMTIGFGLFSVLPMRAGEVARVRIVSRRLHGGVGGVVGSTVLDHLVNGITIAPLALLVPFAPGAPEWMRRGVAIVIGLALAGGVGAWALARRNDGSPRGGWLQRSVMQLEQGFSALRSPAMLLRVLAVGVLAWALETATATMALAAAGLGWNVALAAVTLIAVNLALAVPAPPANVGTFEVGAVLALTALGVQKEHALAFALWFHVLHIGSTWAAALVAWIATHAEAEG